MKIIFHLFAGVALLFAQNGSWWEPAYPLSGDTITVWFDPAASAEMPDNVSSLVLHWGINETGPGDWQTPPQSLWPAGTVLHSDKVAARSPMIKDGNLWKIRVPTDTTISTMHYVINSGTPSVPGSNWAHSDGSSANWNITLSRFRIRAILLSPEVSMTFGDPRRSPVFLNPGDSLQITGIAGLNNTQIDSLTLIMDGSLIAATSGDTIRYMLSRDMYTAGFRDLIFAAVDTGGIADTIRAAVMFNETVQLVSRPAGVRDGITYVDESTVTLSLFAPNKEFVYVLGDFNNWFVDDTYFMHKDVVNADSVHWWLTIENLTPGIEYAFQYLVDGEIRIADPYAHKLLDPWNDEFISPQTYPNLKPYPEGKTTEYVSVLQTAQTPFTWVYSDTFTRPDKHELLIYELLIRDFLHAHDYATLIDTLSYLENLGINAIELMPINEFDGNLSWGYNPAFYFAPDKYYGPAQDLKRFIDECHHRGIAVLLDLVLNHTFGQSPFVRLYNEGGYGRPTPDNPWLNVTARHPFNVGYDFNHESPQTKALVDRVTEYWLTEFKVDGYRFDLSKGFTQKYTTDVGVWGQYDASRIAILKRIADYMWTVDAEAYVILEHFAENREDKELADYGMLVWTNMNRAYSQSTMGWLEDANWSSDLSGVYYKTRNLNEPNGLAYMESHDEQWIMYMNLTYGRSSGGYNIQNLDVALNRMKLAAAFFFTIPGPKMIWQFGELGYDQFLPESGGDRTAEKPILWNYFEQENRRKLYNIFAALMKLRRENEVFRSASTSVSMVVGQGQYGRRINLSHATMNATIIGNFHVIAVNVNPNFPYAGTWYDYFSGDSVQITNPQTLITLAPGEFHIYTDHRLEAKGPKEPDKIPDKFTLLQNFPNPFNPLTTILFDLPQKADIQIDIFNILGQKIRSLIRISENPGRRSVSWDGTDTHGRSVGSGVYIYHLTARIGDRKVYSKSRKMILIR